MPTDSEAAASSPAWLKLLSVKVPNYTDPGFLKLLGPFSELANGNLTRVARRVRHWLGHAATGIDRSLLALSIGAHRRPLGWPPNAVRERESRRGPG